MVNLPLFFRKPRLQTWCGMSHVIYYVYTKEGEWKGACQHVVIAAGIDPSPSMLGHVILPMTTGLGCPRLCTLCTSCVGQSRGHAEPRAARSDPTAATGSPAVLPSCSVARHHAVLGTGQEIRSKPTSCSRHVFSFFPY